MVKSAPELQTQDKETALSVFVYAIIIKANGFYILW